MSEIEQVEPESKRPASMVMTRVGGIDYPLISVPQCKTCQSPHRLIIENHLLQGRTTPGIVRELEAMDPQGEHPSSKGIQEHYKNDHMPLNKAVQRALIERRAEEIGSNLADATGTLIDHVTVARMIVQKGGEKIATGALEPNVAETLAAVRTIHEMERANDGSIDNDMWTSAFMVYMEAARDTMDDEQWMHFSRTLAQHPVLKEIAAKLRSEQAPLDVEVVEETATPQEITA